MIPKMIHYCWFAGKPLPKAAKRCMASWAKFCPGYTVMRWDEQSFDVTANELTRWCWEQGKYAYLSDYVRLWAVYYHGGIYLDVDVELLGTPDTLLTNEAFFGFEKTGYLNTGLGFGAEKGNEAVAEMLRAYDRLPRPELAAAGCPKLNTAALEGLGLRRDGTGQTVAGAAILPADWLDPYDQTTGRLQITDNTLSIHWYTATWLTPIRRLRTVLLRPLHRIVDRPQKEVGR